MKKRKVLFVIPDGVGIRNYLYSDMILILHQAGFEILLMHKLDMELIQLVNDKLKVPIRQIEFQSFPETVVQTFYRESTTFARLKSSAKRKDNPTILSNWSITKSGLKKKLFLGLAEFFGGQLKTYESIRFFESEIERHWKNTKALLHYRKVLDEHNPDLVFITHQRVPSLVPLCMAASSRKIKTISAIFSWDNLPKARLPIRTDYYAVWSDHMKSEFLDFYPEINKDQIFITGTPQFDFYSKEELIIPRKEFAERYQLDPLKKWVLFSGDDEMTSPHDPDYLRDVAEALSPEPEIQILFRQVPVSTPERYRHVLEKYPNIIHIPPLWKKGQFWTSFFPMFEDIQLLMNLCFHCETVLNIGSTMALDFAFFDKPGIFLKYDTRKDANWTTAVIYQFQHFRSMAGLDAVLEVNSKEEILTKVNLAINSPETVAVDRKKWKNRIVKTDRPAAVEFLNLIEHLLPDKSQLLDADKIKGELKQ